MLIEWMEECELARFVAFVTRPMAAMPSTEVGATGGGPRWGEKTERCGLDTFNFATSMRHCGSANLGSC